MEKPDRSPLYRKFNGEPKAEATRKDAGGLQGNHSTETVRNDK